MFCPPGLNASHFLIFNTLFLEFLFCHIVFFLTDLVTLILVALPSLQRIHVMLI